MDECEIYNSDNDIIAGDSSTSCISTDNDDDDNDDDDVDINDDTDNDGRYGILTMMEDMVSPTKVNK
uniref:Bm9709 n=1 Tax=Brugia malayi TaxID=6279 RepID=A0A1I9G1X3_BRUMA|nr:Bm9709 [Brugia malayi]